MTINLPHRDAPGKIRPLVAGRAEPALARLVLAPSNVCSRRCFGKRSVRYTDFVIASGESGPLPPMLGRYELITRIGHGGMAEVQLALQRGPAGFEKLVVVKLIHENLA